MHELASLDDSTPVLSTVGLRPTDPLVQNNMGYAMRWHLVPGDWLEKLYQITH